jgi:tetratricopeptide (TPR) repeat protein
MHHRLLSAFLALVALALHPLRADTVLVLPFFNYSKAPSLEWIGESIAETIHDALASEGVLALDRDDRLEAYRRLQIRPNAVLTKASIIKIGDALDAAAVIYGQYELTAPTSAESGTAASHGVLRITARILDLKRTRQGPEFAENGALEDLAAMETHVGWQALNFLAPKTALSEEEFRRARPSLRVDAVESYVRGLLAAGAEQKHRFFTQAARLDERYSQPAYQLGRIYWDKKEYRIAAGWLERVNRADSHYLEAQFLLGLCRYYLGNFADAVKSFDLVAATVPLNEVYNDLGAAQSRSNLLPAAAGNFRKAVEGDSSDPDFHFNLAYTLWKAGQFSAAAVSFRAVLDRNPGDAEAMQLLGRCLKNDGPRAGEPKSEGRERIKTNYEETAYRQLKAELESKK